MKNFNFFVILIAGISGIAWHQNKNCIWILVMNETPGKEWSL